MSIISAQEAALCVVNEEAKDLERAHLASAAASAQSDADHDLGAGGVDGHSAALEIDGKSLDEVDGLRICDASLASLQVANIANDKDVVVALGLERRGLVDVSLAVQETRWDKRAVGGASSRGEVGLGRQGPGLAVGARQRQDGVVARVLDRGDLGVGHQLDLELLQLRLGLLADAVHDRWCKGQRVVVDEVDFLSALLGVLKAQFASSLGARLATTGDDNALCILDLLLHLAKTALGVLGVAHGLPGHVILG